MGKYNFDEFVNRRGTNSVKWDEEKEDGIIPLWVADMDFLAAPAIRRAVEERAKHGVFGYARLGNAWRESANTDTSLQLFLFLHSQSGLAGFGKSAEAGRRHVCGRLGRLRGEVC